MPRRNEPPVLSVRLANTHVGVHEHGFHDEAWVAHCVTQFELDYYILTCCYICHICTCNAATAKESARVAAEAAGLRPSAVRMRPSLRQRIEMTTTCQG